MQRATLSQADSVRVIREAWAQKADLKTYGEAVAEFMETRLGSQGKLPMSVERWRKFAAQASFGEARERAKSMSIEVFWDWDLPRTPEGFYPITGGRDMATARGLAMAPFCDLVWRETAKPEYVELVALARHFVDDYRAGHPLENDSLRSTASKPQIATLIDPRQLHQILTVLVHNALTYGRLPGEPAQVTLNVHVDEHQQPVIDVIDRGPGIPERVARQLFRPFFTTSSHGTGLGLYIARELCRANQASLDYVPLPAGGSCFRVRLAGSTLKGRSRDPEKL